MNRNDAAAVLCCRTGSALLKEVMETTNDVKGKWDLNPKELLSLTDALIAFNNKSKSYC